MSAPIPTSTHPATSVTAAGPPSEFAVTAKEPAPAAPPIPGVGTSAHTAQEALDKVAQEPSFLGKVANMAQPYLAKVDAVTSPYVEKVQTTTKPYTDAAAVKARELMDKIEGPAHPVPGTTASAAAVGGDGATAAPGGVDRSMGGAAHAPAGEQHGVFDTITKTVSDITHKIDERTASGDKPGLITQLTSAVAKVTDKADAYINAHGPGATNATSTLGHPVQTTTNSVPHTDKPGAQVPLIPSATPAATSAPSTQPSAPFAPAAGAPAPTAAPGAAGAL